MVASTVKCERVISRENFAAIRRLRQKMKRKKPQNRNSSTTPPTTPPTIVPTGAEELDDEADEDEVLLGLEFPVEPGFANTKR